MAILAPNTADVLMLRYILNILPVPANTEVHLYTNNYTPAKPDTLANYTECAATGYTGMTLVSNAWTVSTLANVTTATSNQLVFSFTSATTIFGYLLTTPSYGSILVAEAFTTGGFAIPSGTLALTLNVSLN